MDKEEYTIDQMIEMISKVSDGLDERLAALKDYIYENKKLLRLCHFGIIINVQMMGKEAYSAIVGTPMVVAQLEQNIAKGLQEALQEYKAKKQKVENEVREAIDEAMHTLNDGGDVLHGSNG